MSIKLSSNSPAYKVLTLLSSLKLTVICLSISMILVFLNTLAQVNLGIYEAQNRYFATWFVWAEIGDGGLKLPYIPGGYLVGGILILNLLCAHWKRFSFKWNKLGLMQIHLGILVLLGGGFVTHWLSNEGQLTFDEGQTVQFYESFQERELAISEPLPEGMVRETVFPVELLKAGAKLQGEHLPFTMEILDFYKNTRMTLRRAMGNNADSLVTRGWGKRINVESIKQTFKPKEQNLLSAFVQPIWDGKPIGTWLATNAITDPQWFEVEGRKFALSLRNTRYYLPFELTLLDFKHDYYAGTDVPMNYSSDVRLINEELNEHREYLIYMNHPLRYQGKTFYQQKFANDGATSLLQVVENPGWLIPYISCVLVSIGLFWHFTVHLLKHVNKRRSG
ncbi:MAG: cytochrome c biogenesis protein ResB [Verrucomicrobiota bacterium]